MKEKLLKLKGKTFVVIDWANVYGWFKNLGWEIDLQKLYRYLKSYSEISSIRLYFGVEKGNEKSEQFQKEIRKIGYELISKEVKWVPVSLEKSHFKELAQNLFFALERNKKIISNASFKLIEIPSLIDDIYRSQDKKPLFETIQNGLDKRIPKDNISEIEYGVRVFKEWGDIIEKDLSQPHKEVYAKITDFIRDLEKTFDNLESEVGGLQVALGWPVRRRKCDFDVEISRDVYNNLADFETLLILSGDGDYAALAKDLIYKSKKVIVVFAPGHKGKEYEDFKKGLFLCSVRQLKIFISK